MAILRKSDEPKKKVVPFSPPKMIEKTDAHCVNEGCYEPKAAGQTYVCTKHIRT